jgi:hypothetical protein
VQEAAVIPALRVYEMYAAFKKLVAGVNLIINPVKHVYNADVRIE